METSTILVESIANGNWRFQMILFWNFTSRISSLICWYYKKISIFLLNRYAEKLKKLEILKRLKKEYEKW